VDELVLGVDEEEVVLSVAACTAPLWATTTTNHKPTLIFKIQK
jgi:hypothetical protein